MEDTNKTNNPDAGEKTFTQDDVNRIISERLAKEKNKGEQDFSKREKELEMRELRISAKEMLNERNLSNKLLDALNYSDKETLEKSIATIEEVVKEKTKNTTVKMKGVVPGATGKEPADEPVDIALRKAMGFSD